MGQTQAPSPIRSRAETEDPGGWGQKMWYRGPSSASRLLLCPYELPRLVLETEDLHVLSRGQVGFPKGWNMGLEKKRIPGGIDFTKSGWFGS